MEQSKVESMVLDMLVRVRQRTQELNITEVKFMVRFCMQNRILCFRTKHQFLCMQDLPSWAWNKLKSIALPFNSFGVVK